MLSEMARRAVCIRKVLAVQDLWLQRSYVISSMCQHDFTLETFTNQPNASITPNVISAMYHALTSVLRSLDVD